MKALKTILTGIAALSICTMVSCKSDEERTTWDEYKDWREYNDAWVEEMAATTNADGTPFYTKVTPVWNENAFVLVHWFNDRAATAANLSPIYTSTVDIKYIGYLANKVAFDSSYLSIAPADSVARLRIPSLITGWGIALEQMHVGDTVEVVIPWDMAYGSSSPSPKINPYSSLRFGIKLVDVAGEYIRP